MKSPHSLDTREEAARAGLRYVTDAAPGIRRKRAGTGWSYASAAGRRIRNSDTRHRIARLAIPPAWTSVWICPDPRGHIQATARDARGRKQYRYHPSYRAARDRSKFHRMLVFSEVLPRLREQVERDLRSRSLGRRQLLGTVIRLLDRTLIRVGNDEYARENRSFGLTTLRRRHVAVKGTRLHFEFRGKSGVDHAVDLEDPRIARIVQRCRDLPGREMFQYVDGDGRRHAITSDDVNDHLREVTGRDITAKDFRTWGGTMMAALEFAAMGPATNRRQADLRVNRALDAVAARLGNTRAVCRQFYVHPGLIAAYHLGFTVPLPPRPPGRRPRAGKAGGALRLEEAAVLHFLQRIDAEAAARRGP